MSTPLDMQLAPGEWPIHAAMKFYEDKRAASPGPAGMRSFHDEVEYHLRHGHVRSTADCFVMALPVDLPMGRGWFCSSAVGALDAMARELASLKPPSLTSPRRYIAFSRRGRPGVRFARVDRFVRLARGTLIYGKRNINTWRTAEHYEHCG